MSDLEVNASPESAPGPARSVWLIPALLVVAVVAAVAGKVAVSSCSRLYYPPDHNRMEDPPEYVLAVRNAMVANSAIGYSVFGAALVGLAGLLVGLSRSVAGGVIGLLVGVVLGSLAAAFGAAAGTYFEHDYRQVDMDGMVRAAVVYAALFLAMSLAAMLTTVAAGARPAALQAIVAPVVFAVLGVAAYIIVSTAAFPIAHPDSLQAVDEPIRYVSMVCVALTIAGVCIVLSKPSGRAAPDAG